MKVAALDLGTNTFLLLVAEAVQGKITSVIHDEVRVVRLGQGVHASKRFHPDALARADQCFADFAQIIKRIGVSRILACATSAARDVANGSELIDLGKKHGIPIEVISGEREAELTFLGTVRNEDGVPKDVIKKVDLSVVDVGGGSTEIICGTVAGISSRQSVDVGSVRLTEMFVTAHPISLLELKKMTTYISKRIEVAVKNMGTMPNGPVIAVAGTPTTLATLEQGLPFETQRVDGFELSIDRLRHWVNILAGMTIEQRQKLAGMEPKRADVIVAGALVLLLTAEALGVKGVIVSIRGLRYGVAKLLSTEMK